MKKKYVLILVIFFCLVNLSAKRVHVRDIKNKLGVEDKKKEEYLPRGYSQITGKYYIIQTKDMPEREAQLILRHMEKILDEYLKMYKYPFGTQKCFVKVFGKEKDFKSNADAKGCGNCAGFYYSTGVNNFVVTYNSPYVYSTLSHEALHQFLEKSLGNKPPVWFNEGMATYYETSRFVNDNFVTNVVHREYLFMAKDAISKRSERWPRLKELIRMDNGRFYGKNAPYNYAASWSLIYYLKNKSENAFNSFINDLKLGKSFSTCLRRNYNLKEKELEKKWKDYIIALPGS